MISAVRTACAAVGISAHPSLSGGFESGACDDGGDPSLTGGDEPAAEVGADAGAESGGVLEGGGADAGDGELSAAGEDAGGVCEASAVGVDVDAGFASAPDCDEGGASSSPGCVPPGGWFPVLLTSLHLRSRTC